MADALKRIDYFNTMVGLIFAQLYENFPIPQSIDEAAIARAMGVECTPTTFDEELFDFGRLENGDAFYSMMLAARGWLIAEGFVRIESEFANSEPVLTSKALAVMNATPQGISSGKSIGSRLSDAAKGAGRSASNAAIGDLVGQTIGIAAGLAKGLF